MKLPRQDPAAGPGAAWPTPAEWLLLAALAAWTAGPTVALVIYAGRHGLTWTGAGHDPYDQFQYLSWIRSSGEHGLAANLFGLAPEIHDFLHPMYGPSGLLWRLGASIPVAYLVWKPIALGVLFLGFAAYARRMAPPDLRRPATLLLALFAVTPFLPLLHWNDPPPSFVVAANESFTALQAWGFDHTAITLGLMPLFLLGVESLLAGRARRSTLVLTAIAGLLASWLHSWQGLTLLLIIAALVATGPPRPRHRVLLIPALALLLPLAYGAILAHSDPSWELAAEHNKTAISFIGVGTMLLVFAPLAVPAIVGAVGWPDDVQERMVRLWPLAAFAVYFAYPEFRAHALESLALPLAVLAVRGWSRLRLPLALACLALAVMTVPGAVYYARSFGQTLSDRSQGYFLTADENAALRYLDESDGDGGVLAGGALSLAVPAYTGRQAWAGHYLWTLWPGRGPTADAFFAGTPGGDQARVFAQKIGVRFVVAPCGSNPGVVASLAPITREARRFGCVTALDLGHPAQAGPCTDEGLQGKSDLTARAIRCFAPAS